MGFKQTKMFFFFLII